jgi:hypothetical protein
MSTFKIPEDAADTWADDIAESYGIALSKAVDLVEIDDETGIASTISKQIEGADVSSLKTNINAELEAVDYALVASKLAAINTEPVKSKL